MPLYADDRVVRVLHKLMEVMVGIGLASRKYTGSGMVARWYMHGWHSVRRASVLEHGGAVRIYRNLCG